MTDDFDYLQLDEGIRRTVRIIRDLGYLTTDSGDAVTKFKSGDADEGTMSVPHVACLIVSSHDLADKAARLYNELRAEGARGSFQVEASYAFPDNVSILMVTGLNDDSWGARDKP